MRFSTSGESSARRMAAFSFAITAFGVPAGAAMPQFAHQAYRLEPPERRLNTRPRVLTLGVAHLPSRPAVDRGAFDVRRDVRRHALLPEIGDEVGRVVALVGRQRQAGRRLSAGGRRRTAPVRSRNRRIRFSSPVALRA